MEKIKIGVSACLIGQKVRYNGQHKSHWYINEILAKYFEYISVCPEVSVGMGVPRKSVRLIGELDSPEMIEPISGKNWTTKMNTYSKKKILELGDLSGFIFKRGSPSCGAFRVKIYQKNGIPLADGQGLFSSAFCKKWPLIPVEEEGRLNDTKLRENFLERVFGYHRLKTLMSMKFKRNDWIKFHEKSKFLVLSHSRKDYTILGQLVANIADQNINQFKSRYAETYMAALATKTTPKKHSDALLHILGFLKKNLNTKQKSDILTTIENYRNNIYPLIVPLTLLSHYISVHDIPYVKDQYYLNPHPLDLSLRSHI